MKKIFYRFYLPVMFLASAFFIPKMTALAGNIEIQPGKKNTLDIKESSWQILRFTHSSAEIRTLIVSSEGKDFTKLMMEGYSHTDQVGSPELPVRRELVEVPVNAAVRIEIIRSTYRDFDLNAMGYPAPVMPAQAPAVKSEDPAPLFFNAGAYSDNSFYPEDLVSFDILGTLRSYRIGRLDISPVQYNPVTHTLRVYDIIEAAIYFDDADIEATTTCKAKYENFYFRSIGNSLINYQPPANRDLITSYPISYLIVSDPMFQDQLQPFIEWKTKQGFKVTVGYTNDPLVGSTTNSIKSYIHNIYNNPGAGQQPPSFVLLVGDIQQIPAWNGNAGSHVTDLYYFEYTNDLLPEIYYGRFSAQNLNQLQPQIDKTLQYERYTMPDPSYLNEVVLVAGVDASHGNDWANGQINYGTINYFNASNGIISHTYLYPESGSHADDIIQNISDGVTFGNYTAHCGSNGWADPPFLTSDIPTLQNQDEYGLLVGNCCLSSKFDENECFAEALLRAQNKGATAYIGASNNTYWDEDYYFAVGVGAITEIPPAYEETTLGLYDRAFHTHGEPWEDWYTTADQHVYAGNLAVMTGAPGSAEYYWEIYCVMGDPSLMCYYSEPDPLTVEYLPLMPLGSTSFTVETEPYAYVGISVGGVLKGAALADAFGIAEVPLVPMITPGIADIVVTGQNWQPFIGTVIVANPEGPFILLEDYHTFELSGYTNNKLECGEVIGINIDLRNYGMSDGSGVEANLSSSDEYITITDSHENCGTVPAQSLTTFENAFSIVIDELIPDGHKVEFTLSIEDASSETWISEMTVTLSAPVLNLVSLMVNDNAEGNGNGRLDPGETADIVATFSNKGHAIARNTTADLCAHNGFITITDPDYTIGNLGLLGNTTVAFQAEVDNNAPNGIRADFMVNLRSGEFELNETKRMMIGIIKEDFETGDFSTFNWEQEGNLPWTIISQYPYEGFYCAKSGAISDGQTSEISVSYYVMQADSITFLRKVSSEQNDKLQFRINNVLKGDWSGTTGGWKRESFFVGPGNHTFKWIYSKNSSGSSGSDAAWIDYILFPPSLATTLYAGEDAGLCLNEALQCEGTATNFQSVTWTTSGSGTFNSNTILTPVYTPGGDDYESGFVTLTMSILDAAGDIYNDELALLFGEIPGQPGLPSGPAEILVDTAFISEYSIGPVEGAESYYWSVSPAEAGYFTGCDESGVLVWNRDFGGIAAIRVTAINICGQGTPSQEFLVTVGNSSVGIQEPLLSGLNLSAFPNPSSEILHIRISGDDLIDPSVNLVNTLGITVYSSREFISGKMTDIKVSHLQPGIYFLTVTSQDQSATRKIIIR